MHLEGGDDGKEVIEWGSPAAGRHLAGRPCGRRGTSVAVGRVDARRLGRELGAPGDGSRAGGIWGRP